MSAKTIHAQLNNSTFSWAINIICLDIFQNTLRRIRPGGKKTNKKKTTLCNQFLSFSRISSLSLGFETFQAPVVTQIARPSVRPKQSAAEVLAAWCANGAQILDSQQPGLYNPASSAASVSQSYFYL